MGHDMRDLSVFLSGAVMTGHFVAGLFFFRFWTQTRERLFAVFGLAFCTLAVERVALLILGSQAREEHNAFVYCLRLLAFVMILVGIVDKNRRVP